MSKVDPPDDSAESGNAPKTRRLIADQRYFGLAALAFRAGAERVLAREAARAVQQAGINVRILAEDFRLDAAASRTLLSALLAAGLLQPVGTGHYLPTARLREYAGACVVAPLSRARARTLISRASELAMRINAAWNRNPYRIEAIAVSGSIMSRSDPLPELTLCLVLRKRAELPGRRLGATVGKDAALRQIVAAMRALSSFVVVRIAADLRGVQRPFSLIFEADEDAPPSPVSVWERFRELSASISQRLVAR